MKLKAAASRTLPPALLEALDSSQIVSEFHRVIEEHLSVNPKDIGPATHFVQVTDLTIPLDGKVTGINVALTMVSKNRRRSDDDFTAALSGIEAIYTALIREHVPASESVQLFCALAVDQEILDPNERPVRLLETTPIQVQGRKKGEDRFQSKPTIHLPLAGATSEG